MAHRSQRMLNGVQDANVQRACQSVWLAFRYIALGIYIVLHVGRPYGAIVTNERSLQCNLVVRGDQNSCVIASLLVTGSDSALRSSQIQ